MIHCTRSNIIELFVLLWFMMFLRTSSTNIFRTSSTPSFVEAQQQPSTTKGPRKTNIPPAPIIYLKCGVNSDINLPDHRAVLRNVSLLPSSSSSSSSSLDHEGPSKPCESITIGPNVVVGSIDLSSNPDIPVTIVALILTGVTAQYVDLTGVHFVRSSTTGELPFFVMNKVSIAQPLGAHQASPFYPSLSVLGFADCFRFSPVIGVSIWNETKTTKYNDDGLVEWSVVSDPLSLVSITDCSFAAAPLLNQDPFGATFLGHLRVVTLNEFRARDVVIARNIFECVNSDCIEINSLRVFRSLVIESNVFRMDDTKCYDGTLTAGTSFDPATTKCELKLWNTKTRRMLILSLVNGTPDYDGRYLPSSSSSSSSQLLVTNNNFNLHGHDCATRAVNFYSLGAFTDVLIRKNNFETTILNGASTFPSSTTTISPPPQDLFTQQMILITQYYPDAMYSKFPLSNRGSRSFQVIQNQALGSTTLAADFVYAFTIQMLGLTLKDNVTISNNNIRIWGSQITSRAIALYGTIFNAPLVQIKNNFINSSLVRTDGSGTGSGVIGADGSVLVDGVSADFLLNYPIVMDISTTRIMMQPADSGFGPHNNTESWFPLPQTLDTEILQFVDVASNIVHGRLQASENFLSDLVFFQHYSIYNPQQEANFETFQIANNRFFASGNVVRCAGYRIYVNSVQRSFVFSNNSMTTLSQNNNNENMNTPLLFTFNPPFLKFEMFLAIVPQFSQILKNSDQQHIQFVDLSSSGTVFSNASFSQNSFFTSVQPSTAALTVGFIKYKQDFEFNGDDTKKAVKNQISVANNKFIVTKPKTQSAINAGVGVVSGTISSLVAFFHANKLNETLPLNALTEDSFLSIEGNQGNLDGGQHSVVLVVKTAFTSISILNNNFESTATGTAATFKAYWISPTATRFTRPVPCRSNFYGATDSFVSSLIISNNKFVANDAIVASFLVTCGGELDFETSGADLPGKCFGTSITKISDNNFTVVRQNNIHNFSSSSSSSSSLLPAIIAGILNATTGTVPIPSSNMIIISVENNYFSFSDSPNMQNEKTRVFLFGLVLNSNNNKLVNDASTSVQAIKLTNNKILCRGDQDSRNICSFIQASTSLPLPLSKPNSKNYVQVIATSNTLNYFSSNFSKFIENLLIPQDWKPLTRNSPSFYSDVILSPIQQKVPLFCLLQTRSNGQIISPCSHYNNMFPIIFFSAPSPNCNSIFVYDATLTTSKLYYASSIDLLAVRTFYNLTQNQISSSSSSPTSSSSGNNDDDTQKCLNEFAQKSPYHLPPKYSFMINDHDKTRSPSLNIGNNDSNFNHNNNNNNKSNNAINISLSPAALSDFLRKNEFRVPLYSPQRLAISNPITSINVNILQTCSVVLMALAAPSLAPTFAFTVARQQVVLNFAHGASFGDCTGLLPMLDGFDEGGLSPSDSMTQITIGNSRAKVLVGGAVGNFAFCFGIFLVALVVVNILITMNGNKHSDASSSGRKQRNDDDGDDGRMMMMMLMKPPQRSKSFAEMLREQMDHCSDYQLSALFFSMFALFTSSTLSSGLMVVAFPSAKFPFVEDVSVPTIGEKILAISLSVIFVVCAILFFVWCLFIRHPRRELFVKLKKMKSKSNTNNNNNVLMNLRNYFFVECEGDWLLPKSKGMRKSEKTEFQEKVDAAVLAEKQKKNNRSSNKSRDDKCNRNKNGNQEESEEVIPSFFTSIDLRVEVSIRKKFFIAQILLESYSENAASWFPLLDLIFQILLGISSIVAISVSIESSCFVNGAILVALFLTYLVLSIFKKPFRIFFSSLFIPVITFLDFGIVIAAMVVVIVGRGNSDNTALEFQWINSIATVPTVITFLCSVFIFVISLVPVKNWMAIIKENKEKVQRKIKTLVKRKLKGSKKNDDDARKKKQHENRSNNNNRNSSRDYHHSSRENDRNHAASASSSSHRNVNVHHDHSGNGDRNKSNNFVAQNNNNTRLRHDNDDSNRNRRDNHNNYENHIQSNRKNNHDHFEKKSKHNSGNNNQNGNDDDDDDYLLGRQESSSSLRKSESNGSFRRNSSSHEFSLRPSSSFANSHGNSSDNKRRSPSSSHNDDNHSHTRNANHSADYHPSNRPSAHNNNHNRQQQPSNSKFHDI